MSDKITYVEPADYFPEEIIANYDFAIYENANKGTVTSTVNTADNSITWTISNLPAGESATFKYKLTLKSNYNENIIGVITPTNKKVDVTYTNTDGNEDDETSDVSPTIILTGEKQGKVIVKYVDKDTKKEIADQVIITGTVDDEYDSTPKTIDGYTLSETTNNTSGVITEDDINVVYYYQKVVKENPVIDNTVAPNIIPQTGDMTSYIILSILVMAISTGVYIYKYKK